jgi:hypothetical protein
MSKLAFVSFVTSAVVTTYAKVEIPDEFSTLFKSTKSESTVTSSSLPDPAPCCAYGGSGSALMYGLASLDTGIGSRGASIYSTLFGTSGSNVPSPYSFVFVNSTIADETLAGWAIHANATGQTLYAWNGVSKQCTSDYHEGNSYVPGFDLCPGAGANSLFPAYGHTYNYNGAVTANIYLQPSGSYASFTSASEMCAPIFILTAGTPIAAGGSMALEVLDGNGNQLADNFAQVPSYC